jgi:hypothetical protein
LIFHTNWLSREYVILSYTRYVYGSAYGPSTTGLSYTSFTAPVTATLMTTQYTAAPDPNLFVVSSVISF